MGWGCYNQCCNNQPTKQTNNYPIIVPLQIFCWTYWAFEIWKSATKSVRHYCIYFSTKASHYAYLRYAVMVMLPTIYPPNAMHWCPNPHLSSNYKGAFAYTGNGNTPLHRIKRCMTWRLEVWLDWSPFLFICLAFVFVFAFVLHLAFQSIGPLGRCFL